MLHRSAIAFLVASAPASRSPAQAPLAAHADAMLVHDYRWRDIPRASGWNAELAATARLGNARTGLAAGGWTNVELGTHRNGALTDLEAGHWGPSEYDFWAELAHSFRGGDLAAGFIWYEYRGRAGGLGTGEIYGRVRGSGQGKIGIAPEIALWYDVVKRRSGYLEAGATAPVLAVPLRGLGLLAYVGAAAGFAIGHPVRRIELAATSFDHAGFTSADLSAGFRLHGERALHGVLFNVAGHLQYADDPATRRRWLTPPAATGAVRAYLTLGVGFRWPAPPNR